MAGVDGLDPSGDDRAEACNMEEFYQVTLSCGFECVITFDWIGWNLVVFWNSSLRRWHSFGVWICFSKVDVPESGK